MLLFIAIAALFRPGTLGLVLLLAGGAWMTISRLLRAEILSLKERDFILAARALGLHPFTIFRRHLLPNALTPVLTQTMLLIGQIILVESSLSFLGMGVQPPTATWGNLVADGRESISYAWWIATFPGAAISLAVIAFNLLGDGLRDVLDPRGKAAGGPAIRAWPACYGTARKGVLSGSPTLDTGREADQEKRNQQPVEHAHGRRCLLGRQIVLTQQSIQRPAHQPCRGFCRCAERQGRDSYA